MGSEVKYEIYIDGEYITEQELDVRLQAEDELLVPSKLRCSVGMEPEIVRAIVLHVTYDLSKGIAYVKAFRKDQ